MKYSETRLERTPKENEEEYVLNKVRSILSAIYRKCDVRHWESELVYVLTEFHCISSLVQRSWFSDVTACT